MGLPLGSSDRISETRHPTNPCHRCRAATTYQERQPMTGVTFVLDSASHVFLKTNPLILVVTVPGWAPTTGWHASLTPTKTPPVQNDVLRLKASATPPGGNVSQVLTSIQATFQIVFE